MYDNDPRSDRIPRICLVEPCVGLRRRALIGGLFGHASAARRLLVLRQSPLDAPLGVVVEMVFYMGYDEVDE
jgi:hypothetical protein